MCTCVCVCVYISIRGLEVVGGLLLLGLMASVCDGASALLFSSRRLQAREESKVFFSSSFLLGSTRGDPLQPQDARPLRLLTASSLLLLLLAIFFCFPSPKKKKKKKKGRTADGRGQRQTK